MRRTALVATSILAAILWTIPTHAQEDDSNGFKVFWDDGLHMETEDERFKLQIGGRIQYDWVAWGDDSEVAGIVSGPLLDGTEFRRTRLFVSGNVYETIEYKAQLDFAGGDVVFKDVYIGIEHDTFGFRMGHMKEPFSLEVLTSSKYITFIERSLISGLDAERNSGFLLHGDVIGGDFTYGVGVFRETADNGISIEPGRYNFTGRFAGALRNEDAGRSVVHVGASASYRNDDGSERVFTQRPEVHLAPRFISTGVIPTDGITLIGLEGAVVKGPFSAQAEWKTAPVRSDETGDPRFEGWYAYGSYFLTGESRAYSATGFKRLKPNRNFLDNGGLGAWEVAARYSTLDLAADGTNSPAGPIAGTKLDNVTLALNWYWNPMTVVKLNVIRADIHDRGGTWAFVWRGQLEF